MIKNPVDRMIYDFIMEDIKSNGKNYSILTNTQIGTTLNVSVISVRDKVIKLAKRGYLTSLVNHWDEKNNYFHRKLLKGQMAP
jgi:DNA-binding GntR family transcriptional regulator